MGSASYSVVDVSKQFAQAMVPPRTEGFDSGGLDSMCTLSGLSGWINRLQWKNYRSFTAVK